MEFLETAIEAGSKDINHVSFIGNYLQNGVLIGFEDEGRLPTFVRNDPSVSDNGYEVSDAILSWIKMGICVGTLSGSELPFTDITVSPVPIRVKPNGRV